MVCLGDEVGNCCHHWCDAQEETEHHPQVYQDAELETSHLEEETVHCLGVYQGTAVETAPHLEVSQDVEIGCFLVEIAHFPVVCQDSGADQVVPWEH